MGTALRIHAFFALSGNAVNDFFAVVGDVEFVFGGNGVVFRPNGPAVHPARPNGPAVPSRITQPRPFLRTGVELPAHSASRRLLLTVSPARWAGLGELLARWAGRNLSECVEKTQITNAGLKELAGLTNLQMLHVGGTMVTEAGLIELRKALPECKTSQRTRFAE